MATTSSVSSSGGTSTTNNIVSILGAGSGIDIKALAQNLVDAEKAPRAEGINKKISKTEARISGIAAIKSSILELQSRLGSLKKASTFGPTVATTTDVSTVGVSSTTAARTGIYDIAVSRIATEQRLVGSFASTNPLGMTPPLSVTFALTSDPAKTATVTLQSANNTPQGLVDAINASSSARALGLSADLIKTGTDSKVVIKGASGQANAFRISSNDSSVEGAFKPRLTSSPQFTNPTTAFTTAPDTVPTFTFGSTDEPGRTATVTANTLQELVDQINNSSDAQYLGISASLIPDGGGQKLQVTTSRVAAGISVKDNEASGVFSGDRTKLVTAPAPAGSQKGGDAEFTVNGISVSRPNNQVSDAVSGITFNLNATTATNTVTRISVTRDTTAIKDNVGALVTSYNALNDALGVLNDPKSTVEVFGGALAGDSLIRTLRSQINDVLTLTNGTPSQAGAVTALRDIGLSLDKTGKLQLDSAKLDTVLAQKYDQMVAMFTANSDNTSVFLDSGGVASNAFNRLDAMLRSTGILSTQAVSAQRQVTQYKAELTKLDERMASLLDRYMKQFSVMDSFVNESNATRSRLKSTFDGMSNSKN